MNKTFIFFLCAFVATLSSYADVKIGGINYSIVKGTNTVTVVPDEQKVSEGLAAQDITGDVAIPSTIEYEGQNYKVTEIKGRAFVYCSEITSISIPSSVKSIWGWAFCQCAGLKSVYMEDGGVTSIEDGGVTSIYVNAFEDCQNLTTISIPSTITSIGQYAFKGCSNLRNVIINKQDLSTITVGKDAFAGLPKTETPNLYLPVGSGIQGKIEFGGIDFNAIPSIPSVSVTYNTAYTRTETPDCDVIYYRDFAGIGNWQALFLPFTSDYSEWSEYFIIADLVESQKGDGQDVLCWYELGEHNKVLAGHPYIIKRRKNTENTGFVKLPADMQSFRIFNDKTVKPASHYSQIEIEGDYGKYTLGGTYAGGTASEIAANLNGDFYALGMDGNFVKAEDTSTQKLSANRIYLLVSPKKNSAQANQAPFRMSFMEEDLGEPSSIDDCLTVDRHGDDAIYDLYGRSVSNPKSGIYIKNGRKYIIK